MSSILFDKHPLVVNPTLASIIGLEEAIILQQIHYWIEKKCEDGDKKFYHDDMWWVYNSYDSWLKQFPFMSKRTLQRSINKLEKKYNLIITGNYNRYSYDRTKWYTVNYDTLEKVERDHDAKMALWNSPKSQNPTCQNGTTNTIDYITKTTTENTNIECIPTECPIGHDADAWHWQDDNTYYNYINSVLPRYINNILPIPPYDNSSYNIYYTAIAGFYESYYENVGEYHPWYKEETLKRVIESLNDFFEIIDCETIFDCMRLFFSKSNIRSKHLMVFCQYDMLRFLTAEIECDYKGILLDAK